MQDLLYWPRIPDGPEIVRTPLDHSELHPHGIDYTEPLKVFYIALHQHHLVSFERPHRYIADVSHLVHMPRDEPEASRATAEKAACAIRGSVPFVKYESERVGCGMNVRGMGVHRIFKGGREIALTKDLMAHPHRKIMIRHLDLHTGEEEETLLRLRLTSGRALKWTQNGYKYKWTRSGVLYKLNMSGEVLAVVGKTYMHAKNRPRVLVFNEREVDEVCAVLSASRMDRYSRRGYQSRGLGGYQSLASVYVGRKGPM